MNTSIIKDDDSIVEHPLFNTCWIRKTDQRIVRITEVADGKVLLSGIGINRKVITFEELAAEFEKPEDPFLAFLEALYRTSTIYAMPAIETINAHYKKLKVNPELYEQILNGPKAE
jgi:hypothetical protein